MQSESITAVPQKTYRQKIEGAFHEACHLPLAYYCVTPAEVCGSCISTQRYMKTDILHYSGITFPRLLQGRAMSTPPLLKNGSCYTTLLSMCMGWDHRRRLTLLAIQSLFVLHHTDPFLLQRAVLHPLKSLQRWPTADLQLTHSPSPDWLRADCDPSFQQGRNSLETNLTDLTPYIWATEVHKGSEITRHLDQDLAPNDWSEEPSTPSVTLTSSQARTQTKLFWHVIEMF